MRARLMGRSMTVDSRTPSKAGFAMPAEWEAHDACYMSWPCRPETWQGFHEEAKATYVAVARAVRRFEPVIMLAPPSRVREARDSLGPDDEVVPMELDDAWIRDNGPIFVRRPDGRRAVVNFRFNGWGGKAPWRKDDEVPVRLAERLGMRRYDAPMVLEGGAISVDGEGTLLTTEQCLPSRNRSMSRARIERVLADYLGIRKVIWLGRGLKGDFTGGHVDGVAGFAAPRVVVAAHAAAPSDPNRAALADNLVRLGSATDAKGRSIEVVTLPQPRPRTWQGLPVTPGYVNHYIANGGVVVPTFGISEDAAALATLRVLHPGREIVGVPARYLEFGEGSVHCITQQRPGGRGGTKAPSGPGPRRSPAA